MKIKLFTLPNIITLANLLCGCCSIVAALVWGDLTLAFVLILAAAVCDFMDGATARLLKAYSEIGVQLDSLADMVSFGVAPSVGAYVLATQGVSLFGLGDEWVKALCFVPFIMAAFSALRLAKFNIDDTQHEEFCGLPTPANAILCLSLVMLAWRDGVTVAVEWVALVSIVLALLLISPIRMFSFKFKSLAWRANEVRYLFAAGALIAIFVLRTYSIPLIIVSYIVVSTLLWIVRRAK
ncbi:MAG: CDP-diacylglycerol--serine O-phosphatidyltransferase [Alistipes sp.]|nr:CDP-diacylglycerol--serine O-phosphatidyltransferase [Alistipes sp.]